ncbi:MAG: hypothetical protein QOI50_1030 [Pseudonocardiales bacterium]|nr:hypothetical protein [Pseudonocardiales bacterium]
MDADSCPLGDQAGELILHRPQTLTPGAARRIQVYLDDQQIANLEHGATMRVPTEEGPHLLRARCLPLISAELPFVLAAAETLKVLIYVGAPEDLRIDLDPESASP